MKAPLVIHRLALLSLAVIAATSILGSMRQPPGATVEMRLAPVFGLAIWSLLIWKIWKRPRKWGLGVGVFLFLMVAFQCYLWSLAVSNPETRPTLTASDTANFILLDQLPIFIAAVFCSLLRFYHPGASEEDTAK